MVWVSYPETPEYKQYFDTLVEARKTAVKYLEFHPRAGNIPIFSTLKSKKPTAWVGVEVRNGKQNFYYTESIRSYGTTMYAGKPLNKNGKIRRN